MLHFNQNNIHLNKRMMKRIMKAIDKYIYMEKVPKPAKMKTLAADVLFEHENLFDFEVNFETITKTASGHRRLLLGSSAKVKKGELLGFVSKVMYLMASDRSGFQLCPWAGDCKHSCLEWTTGRMRLSPAQKAHYLKALWWKLYPLHFLRTLVYEIIQFGMETWFDDTFSPVVRLDGTSDQQFWQYIDIDSLIRDTNVGFYDYTKRPIPAKRLPKSYHVTFSIDEGKRSMINAQRYLDAGYSAAIVVAGKDNSLRAAKAAQKYILDMGYFLINDKAYPVIDGDKDDLRFLDPPGSVVVLHAKGKEALSTESRFVYRVPV